MATIDLIVLGILKKESLSAYDIQKLVEYRNISKWVKISTPSIYKKVIQLEERGYIKSNMIKEGKMPEKAVYSLTAEKDQHDLPGLQPADAADLSEKCLLPHGAFRCTQGPG